MYSRPDTRKHNNDDASKLAYCSSLNVSTTFLETASSKLNVYIEEQNVGLHGNASREVKNGTNQ